MPVTAYIALGSNLGKRQTALRSAIARVGRLPGTRVTKVATFRQTAPVGGPPGQRPYINSAMEVQTELSPAELLQALLAIEKDLGRDRAHEVRNGPRTIDLDLLLYADHILDLPALTIPHPRLHERRFVLEPLAEIAPAAVHPILGKTAAALLSDLPPEAERQPQESPPPP